MKKNNKCCWKHHSRAGIPFDTNGECSECRLNYRRLFINGYHRELVEMRKEMMSQGYELWHQYIYRVNKSIEDLKYAQERMSIFSARVRSGRRG